MRLNMKKITSLLLFTVVLSFLFMTDYSSASEESLYFKDLKYRSKNYLCGHRLRRNPEQCHHRPGCVQVHR